MKRKSGQILLSFCFSMCIFLVNCCHTYAYIITPIDLNAFYAERTVTISPDGSSAVMREDEVFFIVFLSNDPLLGDSGIVVPALPISLNFDYIFTEAQDNDDEFYARVFDGMSGLLIDDWGTESSRSGTISFDLSDLDASVTKIGFEFQLRGWDQAYAQDTSWLLGSIAEVSNVVLVSRDVALVPEPSTFLLFSIGVLSVLALVRTRKLR